MLANGRSRSLMEVDSKQPELQDHLEMLIEQSEELIKEKLEKQLEKEARVEAVQRAFTEWVEKKQNELQLKLAKSAKNKEEYISKIVKKCKDHDKFLGEKLKKYQTNKKASLREAWKKANQMQTGIKQYQIEKQFSKQKMNAKNQTHFMTESHYVQEKALPPEKNQPSKEYLPNQNTSKIYGNASKDYWAQLNQSVSPSNKRLKVPQQPFAEPKKQRVQEYGQSSIVWKLKETLTRFRQHTQKEEQAKIQQLGEHLEKIEQSRLKRMQLYTKKKDKRNTTIADSRVHQKQVKKINKNYKSERVHSESIMRERRVKDWSQTNKNKRQEYEQLKLQHGTEYLQTRKLKYLKTNLAKRIAFEAIEKKLYFQRLNH